MLSPARTVLADLVGSPVSVGCAVGDVVDPPPPPDPVVEPITGAHCACCAVTAAFNSRIWRSSVDDSDFNCWTVCMVSKPDEPEPAEPKPVDPALVVGEAEAVGTDERDPDEEPDDEPEAEAAADDDPVELVDVVVLVAAAALASARSA